MADVVSVQVLLFLVLVCLPASDPDSLISKVQHVIGFEFVGGNHLAIAVEHNIVLHIAAVLSNPVVTTGTLDRAFIPLLALEECLGDSRIVINVVGNIEYKVSR